MNRLLHSLFLIVCSPFILASAYADSSVCIKNGSEISVSGQSEQERQQDCESQNGSWSTKQAPAPQSSGGGGGW